MNKYFWELILGIPKSIYFNFHYFDMKTAIRLPVLVSKNVRLRALKGKVNINGNVSSGMIKIGFGDVGIFDRKLSKSIIQFYGTIIFNGQCKIGHGKI